MGAAHRLAVDGHHFALGELGHGLDPLNETMLELLRIQPGEDVSEGIMGRDTVGQLQEGLEPLLFAVAEELDIHPVIGAADGATNGDGDDIQEFVPLGAVDPGVVQRREVFDYGCTCCLNHHYHSHIPTR